MLSTGGRESLPRFEVFDLGRPLDADTPHVPNVMPFRMALVQRPGDVVRDDLSSSSTEFIFTSGHNGTHIDAFAHVSLDGRMYGGHDALEAASGGGFSVHGVETIAPIVTRGILLDIPGVEGSDSLEPGRPVTADDCERACRYQGVEQPGEGEAVLFRTGWPVGRYGTTAYVGLDGAPGPDLSAAQWLSERGVKVAGSDTMAFECFPVNRSSAVRPVHVHLLVEAGIHIIEIMDLERLAEAKAHEFLFVCSPLKIAGATGSPVRPLALVPVR